jgi:hypothetical protein
MVYAVVLILAVTFKTLIVALIQRLINWLIQNTYVEASVMFRYDPTKTETMILLATERYDSTRES